MIQVFIVWRRGEREDEMSRRILQKICVREERGMGGGAIIRVNLVFLQEKTRKHLQTFAINWRKMFLVKIIKKNSLFLRKSRKMFFFFLNIEKIA